MRHEGTGRRRRRNAREDPGDWAARAPPGRFRTDDDGPAHGLRRQASVGRLVLRPRRHRLSRTRRPRASGRRAAQPRGGWVGFDFRRAFGRPVKVINDAAMQALGSYRGGRMLFLGLGTGLGSALIIDGALEPMELAHLPYKHGSTFEEYVGIRGFKRLGKARWRKCVLDV